MFDVGASDDLSHLEGSVRDGRAFPMSACPSAFRPGGASVALIVAVIGVVGGACTRSPGPDDSDVLPGATTVIDVPATAPVESTTSMPVTTTTSGPGAAPSWEGDSAQTVGERDGTAVDPTRDRTVPFRVFAPLGTDAVAPVVVISHGGSGRDRGYTTANHFGEALAAAGFVAVHVGHRASVPPARQRSDRPADVSFVLDLMAEGALDLPDGFGGVVDLSRVGHLGHSFGAFTAHALAGAVFMQGGEPVVSADPRIDAIVALSPQGVGQSGAFADADGTTTWSSVEVPVLAVAGSEELDTNARGDVRAAGWRLQPFEAYPGTADTFMVVIDGADHSDLWRTGGADLERWLSAQVVTFFEVYVAEYADADACSVGAVTAFDRTATVERRAGSSGSALTACG